MLLRQCGAASNRWQLAKESTRERMRDLLPRDASSPARGLFRRGNRPRPSTRTREATGSSRDTRCTPSPPPPPAPGSVHSPMRWTREAPAPHAHENQACDRIWRELRANGNRAKPKARREPKAPRDPTALTHGGSLSFGGDPARVSPSPLPPDHGLHDTPTNTHRSRGTRGPCLSSTSPQRKDPTCSCGPSSWGLGDVEQGYELREIGRAT